MQKSTSKKNTKRVAIVGATTAALLGGGVAFAYWTTSGTGAGSAATSAGAANLKIAQTSTISNMYPGDSPQTIRGTVTNNAANSAYVTKVVVSITGVTQASGATGSCDAGDYTLTNAEMAVGTDIASQGSATFSGAQLQFNNKDGNQDGCKGATVNLAYAAS